MVFCDNVMGKEGNVPLEFVLVKLWNILPNGRSTAFYSIGSLCEKHADWFRADLTELFNLLAQGRIKPVIAERMSLAEATRAHGLIEWAAVRGGIVLIAVAQQSRISLAVRYTVLGHVRCPHASEPA